VQSAPSRLSNAVEAAYRRGDSLEKRRRLMDAWAAFLESGSADNVVPLKTPEANAK
jgi:hypothetical protein